MTDSTREINECYDMALLLRNYSTFYCHKQQTEIILKYSYFPMVHLNEPHYLYFETKLQNLCNDDDNDDNFLQLMCIEPVLIVYYSVVCSKIHKSQV